RGRNRVRAVGVVHHLQACTLADPGLPGRHPRRFCVLSCGRDFLRILPSSQGCPPKSDRSASLRVDTICGGPAESIDSKTFFLVRSYSVNWKSVRLIGPNVCLLAPIFATPMTGWPGSA